MVRFRLPTAEDDVWSEFVTRLLWQKDVSEPQARNHLRLLEELGFHKEFCQKPLTETFVLDTATWLAVEMKLQKPDDKACVWLRDIENWQLLIRNDSGNQSTYEFPIPGLDEYFAACHLAARWAEEDRKYWTWLPCYEGWWEKTEGLICPNPHCEFPLPSFPDILSRADHEETLLLLVGLLKEADREKVFLNGIVHGPNFALKVLSRCRHAHPGIGQDMLTPVWSLLKEEVGLQLKESVLAEGLFAIGRARLYGNLAPFLHFLVNRMYFPSLGLTPPHIGMASLEEIYDEIDDEDRFDNVICFAMTRLGEIAIPAIIAGLSDRRADYSFRFLAERVIKEIKHESGNESG